MMDNKDHDVQVDDVSRVQTPPDDNLDNSNIQTRTQIPLPPLLRDLSDEDRHKLDLKLRRKIDLRLLPMIVIMYILNYLDRNNIAAARLAGMPKDLNLKANEFQVGVLSPSESSLSTVLPHVC
jgi:hypothetical protein